MNRWFRICDPYLLLFALIASGIGSALIYDASYARSYRLYGTYFATEFKAQLVWLAFSIFVSLILGSRHPGKQIRWAVPAIIVTILGLIAVELWGTTMNGAKRWLTVMDKNIQPSEFAKFAIILFLAMIFSQRPIRSGKIKTYNTWYKNLDFVVWPQIQRFFPALVVLLILGLILKEKDLGTAAVVAFVAFMMAIPGKVSHKSVIAGALFLVCAAGFSVFEKSYRLDRIAVHAKRWESENVDDTGYQTVQAELHQAAGGILGVGVGGGHAKQIMPATTTDFIMATIGEETGLWGSLLVLGSISLVVGRLLQLAKTATTHYSVLILYGSAMWIGVQAATNFMMANGLLPAIGIPLPFISSGGSSLLALWIAVGASQGSLLPIPVTKPKKKTVRAKQMVATS